MLFSSFSTRSMVFAYFAKAQLPFSLFRDLFNDTAEFTLCYGLHDCSHLFQGYFIHSLSTLYYYNAPSLTTRLTGDYRDRTYTGKCSPALLDTHRKNRDMSTYPCQLLTYHFICYHYIQQKYFPCFHPEKYTQTYCFHFCKGKKRSPLFLFHILQYLQNRPYETQFF